MLFRLLETLLIANNVFFYVNMVTQIKKGKNENLLAPVFKSSCNFCILTFTLFSRGVDMFIH